MKTKFLLRYVPDQAIMISWPDQFCFILTLFFFLVGDMREIRIQPLLIRRSIDFPSPLSPSSPRTPNTPGFFEDLGSLDPSLYTMVAEVCLTGVLFEYLLMIQGKTSSKASNTALSYLCV